MMRDVEGRGVGDHLQRPADDLLPAKSLDEEEFQLRGVNLSRIESRPTGAALGNYCFSLDAEGHVSDRRVGEALMGLRRVCADVRFLGSYERHDGQAPTIRPGTTERCPDPSGRPPHRP